ncbi:hypothetical protein C8Q70DRAFT_114062 [Cubamyces menziesii]|nr:hypothetical protein C8Q70DRAFT_114062 [Cubamyces menziesii]
MSVQGTNGRHGFSGLPEQPVPCTIMPEYAYSVHVYNPHTLAPYVEGSSLIAHSTRQEHIIRLPGASSEFDRHTRSRAEMRSCQTGPPMWHRDIYAESDQARSDPCQEALATPLRSSVRGFSFVRNIPGRFVSYPHQGLCRARKLPMSSMLSTSKSDIRACLSTSSSLWVRITSAIGPSGSLNLAPFPPPPSSSCEHRSGPILHGRQSSLCVYDKFILTRTSLRGLPRASLARPPSCENNDSMVGIYRASL